MNEITKSEDILNDYNKVISNISFIKTYLKAIKYLLKDYNKLAKRIKKRYEKIKEEEEYED